MTQEELNTILNNLIANWEDEVTEFKQAKNDYSTSDIGKYFSAIANEANLREQPKGWLVFGINNKSRSIVGTDYREDNERLQGLKMQIAENTEPSITFREIHVLNENNPKQRVVLFEIPVAPKGMPIAWKGHYYARAGESLTSLGLDKLDEIRQQTIDTDWTAQIVPNATFDDLDELAVAKARESFARKYANRFEETEVENWSLNVFLDRAKLTINGKLTNTTIILLGKSESTHLLSPHPVQMTWKLEGAERAYEHFSPPFLLNTSSLYQKIRNIQLRILPDDALLAIEVSKYDQKVILEALHNCIAHQDYTRNGRIIVTEMPDRLIFENEGSFYEGLPNDYISGNKTPRRYRNPFLVQAMTELNMIDTMGYGIYEMHVGQARRYFPLPDYDLSDNTCVKMTIYGSVVDPAYSRLLIQKTDLAWEDILLLDRVQKKLPLSNEAIQHLKRKGLVEGRKPNIHVSAKVAKATASKAEYIKTRAQDDDYYIKLTTDFIEKFGKASRDDIDKLLSGKLSDGLDEAQKAKKIGNLLTKMRRSEIIFNKGSRTSPEWIIAERMQKENS